MFVPGPQYVPIPGNPVGKVLSFTRACSTPFLYPEITFPIAVASITSPLDTPNFATVSVYKLREIPEFAFPSRNAHVSDSIRRHARAYLIACASVGEETASQPQFHFLVWSVLLIDTKNNSPRHLIWSP